MATLTTDQQTAKTAFATFVAGGAVTQVGFAIDPASIKFQIDMKGTLRAQGNVLDVDLTKVNPMFKEVSGQSSVIPSMSVFWDMNGISQTNQAFNLIQVVPA